MGSRRYGRQPKNSNKIIIKYSPLCSPLLRTCEYNEAHNYKPSPNTPATVGAAAIPDLRKVTAKQWHIDNAALTLKL